MSYAKLTRPAAGLFLGLIIIILSAVVPCTAHGQAGGQSQYREGEVLVRMKASTGLAAEHVPDAAISALARKLKGVKAHKLRSNHVVPGLYALTLNPGERVEDKVRELKADPDVENAQPNYIYHAFTTVPNDPSFGQQWGLRNTVYPGKDMHMPSAWDVTTGSPSVVVGVIDSGIDYNHPDLKPNLWVNTGEIPGNGFDDDGNGYIDDVYGIDADAYPSTGDPYDGFGHGTHVAGIIGARGNNSVGIAGVNWNVGLMALKFLDSFGIGFTFSAIECIDYAVAMKSNGVNIRVINASWGSEPGAPHDTFLEDAITSAANNDILFVAAAGNFSNDNDTLPSYPASSSSPNVIAVAATDNTDKRPTWSNYGAHSVHVAAPGVNILSTVPRASTLFSGQDYASLSGTSSAAPFVSGLAALILSHTPDMTVAQLKNAIMGSVDKISGLPVITGGRVNAASALAFRAVSALTLTGAQNGAFTTLSVAASTADALPVYARKINFYQDGLYVGRSTTGSASSSSPGTATLTFRATLGTHSAYAGTTPSYDSELMVMSPSVTYTTVAPAIDHTDKSQASVGVAVTIIGSGFGARKRTVLLADSSAPGSTPTRIRPSTWTDTIITFSVPYKKAGSYSVSVDNALATSNSVAFAIPVPAVGSVSPANPQPAKSGSVVTVSGQYFGLRNGRLQLSPSPPNGMAPFDVGATTWLDTAITFVAPPLPPGVYNLTVSNYAGTSLPFASVLITQ